MNAEPLPYKQVIFVCANARSPKERISCAGAGRCGLDVLEKLKNYINANGLKHVARAAKSGCQEKCELGPTAMLMPQNIFLSELTLEDADKIIREYLEPLRSSSV